MRPRASEAMSACEKGGKWEKTLQLFSGLAESHVELDIIKFSAAISAFEKGGECENAWQLFSVMAQSKAV